MDPLSLYLKFAKASEPVQQASQSSGGSTFMLTFVIFIFMTIGIFVVFAGVYQSTFNRIRMQINCVIDNDGNIIVRVIDESATIPPVYDRYRINNNAIIGIAKRRRLNIGTNSTQTVYRDTGNFWKVFLDLESNTRITKDDVMKNYKRLAMMYHPDKPTGSQELMKKLNRAKDEALKVVK